MNEDEDFLKQLEKSGVYNPMQICEESPTDSNRRNIGSGAWGRRLLSLAKAGDAAGVARLAALGAPLCADWLGAGPLHAAAEGGHVAAAEALLKAGAHKDARTKLDRTPLHFAAYYDHYDVLKLLLDFGANVDLRDMLGMSALHWAVERGSLASVSALVRAGSDVTAKSKFRKTPLQLAAKRPDLLRVILDIVNERESRAAATAFVEVEEEQQPQIEEIPPQAENLNKSKTSEEQKDKPFKIETGVAAALLRSHGITLLPTDAAADSTALSAIKAGRSVVLSDAGRLLLSECTDAARVNSQPLKVVQIRKDVKITGIKRPATAIDNPIVTSTTGSGSAATGSHESPEVSDDDVIGNKSPQANVKIIMNKDNFNKLVATANRIHSPEKQEETNSVRVRMVPNSEQIVVVPSKFIRSKDPHYLRSQLLCAHAALAQARDSLKKASDTIKVLKGEL